MELGLAILLFIIGLLFVIKGGDWFVESATWIARVAKIPTFIIGSTIVSFATTLPELLVSLFASIENKNEMAVGNAIGSIIANTGLVMGIALAFMSIVTPRKNYWQQSLLLISSCILLWSGCLSKTLNIWISLVLLIIYVVFIVINLIQGRREIISDKTLEGKNTELVTKQQIKLVNKKNIFLKIIFFIIGAAGIILGSNLLISGGTTIAQSLGIPERVIAITLVAVGTSLPELMTTITAVRKKESGLSIGNIIGSNIINLTLILPTCSLVGQGTLSIPTQTLIVDFPFCLAFSLISIIPILWKQRTYKWQGITMLLGYVAYIIISVLV